MSDPFADFESKPKRRRRAPPRFTFPKLPSFKFKLPKLPPFPDITFMHFAIGMFIAAFGLVIYGSHSDNQKEVKYYDYSEVKRMHEAHPTLRPMIDQFMEDDILTVGEFDTLEELANQLADEKIMIERKQELNKQRNR